MIATYPASLVDRASLELRDSPDWGPILWFRLSGKTKDVFDPYYQARDFFQPRENAKTKKRPIQAPYEVFADWGSDVEAIQNFTEAWGPLSARPDPGPFAILDGRKREIWEKHRDPNLRQMNALHWQHCQGVLRTMLNLAGSGKKSDQRKLVELLQTPPEVLTPAGRPIRTNFWGDGRSNLEVRFQEGAAQPVLAPTDLWEAFLLMLWLDLGTNGLRRLKCPRCGKWFATNKRNKKYCDANCAAATSRKAWWQTKGNEWRKNRKAGG